MGPAEVASFLEGPHTAVLSTIARDGGPHAAGMWYVADDREIRMWTYRKSQKAVNLRRDPRAAFLVETGTAYAELRGVLVRGRVRVVTDPTAVATIGLELYERYTQEGPIVEIERQAQKRVGLVLPLIEVASWDHSKLGR